MSLYSPSAFLFINAHGKHANGNKSTCKRAQTRRQMQANNKTNDRISENTQSAHNTPLIIIFHKYIYFPENK